ncbi:MAG TPA: DUF1192 domain-containing protein [Alphaproteobacteria bacterium]|jgi:uncharacterized small protein (DUF1192 family)|nr:DUF1192 domain-containing protein [Alphaproteobacteria bacterium]
MFDDLEPQKQTRKLKPLDDMSVDELKEYVVNLQAEIARVEATMKAKQSHMAAMDALFKKPE